MLNSKAITRAREKQGISQTELSKRSGIRVDAISRLENGRVPNPTLATIEKLSKALEIKASELID